MDDYYQKYIKYKEKYIQLKSNNMIGGTKKDILFILFGGYGMHNDLWNYNLETMEKTNFLEKLKDLGDTYCYYPKFYNIQKYIEENDEIKKFYKDDNLDFILDDISFKKGCDEVLEYINKNKKYKKYVFISTSIGIHYAIEMSKNIDKDNYCIISIEGSSIGENAKIKFATTLEEYETKYRKYTNKDLQDFIKKHNYTEINNLINSILILQIDFSMKKFKCPSLHFQNIIIKKDISEKDNKKNLLKIDTSNKLSKNDDNYKIIWLINKGHVAFGTDTDNIIYFITNFI